MSRYLDWPDYLVIVALLVLYLFVGVFYGFRSHFTKLWHCICHSSTKEKSPEENLTPADDIFLGNRKITLLPIVASTMASFMSAVAIMGNNSEAYCYGIEFVMLILGYCIAFPVAAEVYTPVFYKLGVLSAHEYLELRFSRLLRWLVTVVFCFQMVVYIAVVLYAPSLALSRVTGWPVYSSILISGILGTFYTALGGIRAVVWTDLIQTIVMLGGFVLILVFGCQQVGGIERIWEIASRDQRLNVLDFDPNPFVRHSIWTLMIGGAGMTLTIFATNQTQVQRYLACRDLKTARRAIHLQLPMNAVFLSVQMLTGLVTYAVFVGCDPKLNGEITDYDQIFPHLVMRLFSDIPVLRGLFLSTVFAAALSTLSSGVNGIACVLVEDVFMDIYLTVSKGSRLRRSRLTFIARFIAILFGLVIIGLAFLLQVVPAGVLRISFSIFGAIGGPILTVFTLGIIFPFINKWGALFGFLGSLVAGLTMIVGTLYFYTFQEHVLAPLTNATCSIVNSSVSTSAPSLVTAVTPAPPPEYGFSFFNLSYLYLTPFCLLVGLVIAVPISLLTGKLPAT
uniref:Sodium-coupled monocarboxylate transporter 2 n=3 Tax=Mesocestoides corti TaxID=53468 RepID=A0A5K3FSX5_MESCO